ncbi:MAG: hypothetical protein QXU18_08330 [Thermoplasmatales archaeon]
MTKPYLLTMDGVEVLVYKLGITEVNYVPGLKSAILEVQETLATVMKNMIPPDYQLKIVYASSLSEGIDKATSKIKKMNGSGLVVSLDRVYGSTADFHLEVTRETDPTSGSYRIANRFGAPAVDEQLNLLRDMMKSCSYNGIILTDVGSFEGKTLDFMMDEMRKFGITTLGVVLGVSSEKLAEKLKNKYNGSSAVVETLAADQNYEWLEMRDLLLLDGRKVPSEYTKDGIRRYIPYTEDLHSYASIPEDKVEECKAYCNKAYSEIARLLRNAGVDVDKRVGKFIQLTKSLSRG